MSIFQEIEVVNQTTAFGELATAQLTPIVQLANQYGIDPTLRDDLETYTDSISSGTTDSNNNLFRCQSGTSVGGYGVIRSKEPLIYRAGQGLEGKFTASFTTGIATSLQFGGLFSLTETMAFGYDGANFGIIHENHGKPEVQVIVVTGVAGGAETATVTLDGDAVSVDLTASTVQENAFEIARDCADDVTVGAKWRFEQVDDTVYAISQSVGDKTGTMSFSSATATATVTESQVGVAKTSNNVAQTSWSETTTPFTGFDPTKLNLYKVQYGYLGVASIKFYVYNPNTSKFVLVHVTKWANSYNITNTGNPNMKIGWTATSLGSSGTNLIVQGASASMGVEGLSVVKNTSFANDNSVSAISTTDTALLTIKTRVLYGNSYNLSKATPINLSINNDHTKGAIISVIKNTALAGATNYQYEDVNNSIVILDKSGGSVSGGTIVEEFTVGAGGSIDINLSRLKIQLLPGETLSVVGRTISNAGAIMTATLAWLEEK